MTVHFAICPVADQINWIINQILNYSTQKGKYIIFTCIPTQGIQGKIPINKLHYDLLIILLSLSDDRRNK